MRTAIEHRQQDRIPLDFGSTAVTGVHVRCVAALRDDYGLASRPVKMHEPYQMPGFGGRTIQRSFACLIWKSCVKP
ncbi:MAG: hypothetical protein LAQ69_21555 [Acidobacteriia bacterium]|nr:hypothetical protein [Terriglobia bacterium]